MRDSNASTAERVSTVRSKPSKQEHEDADLRWFLECGDSVLGARGTLGGIISALEHGGHGSGGVPNTDLYTDQQVGWGRHVFGEVERHRWLATAWHALTDRSKGVLGTYYSKPRAEFRSDEGFGARDRFVEGSDGATGRHGATRTGVEALLGEFASLAFELCSDPAKLLVACREPDPTKTNKGGLVVTDRDLQAQRRKLRADAIKLARAASEEAHREWAESKAAADPMRKRAQRSKPMLVGGSDE